MVSEPVDEGSVRSEKEDNKTEPSQGFLAKLKSLIFGGSRTTAKINLNDVDLTEEELEELRMIGTFSDKELRILRVKFLSISDGEETVLPKKIFEFPEIGNNPLRERIVKCFDVDNDGRINFKEFISVLSILSQDGKREQKLKIAFIIHDYDGDGKISKEDLKQYLWDVTSFPYSPEELENRKLCEAEEAESLPADASLQDKIEFIAKRIESIKKAKGKRKKDDEKKTVQPQDNEGNPKENENSSNQDKDTDVKNEDKRNDTVEDDEKQTKSSLYEERLKFLVKKQILEEVTDRVFEESSTDNQFLTREDFIRVVGHSDFQGRLVINLTKMKPVT